MCTKLQSMYAKKKTITYSNMHQQLRLVSCDERAYVVDRGVISRLSKKIRRELAGTHVTTVRVPRVDAKTLLRVVSYCNQHWRDRSEEIPKPLPKSWKEKLCAFDFEYVRSSPQVLANDLLAAKQLQIDDLVQLVAAAIADLVRKSEGQEIIDKLT